ncbi:MAG: glycoside hydrolase family 97 protein [Bacteroidales bacterium]|nr:glycoside hydrolase family 97 protein [Bacteroidales bacterium]
MKKSSLIKGLCCVVCGWSSIDCVALADNLVHNAQLSSPDGDIVASFDIDEAGHPVYSVTYKGLPIVKNCRLGLTAKEVAADSKYTMECSDIASVDETWQPVWGEYAEVRNNYNEMSAMFRCSSGLDFDVKVRVFDDGLGFRYELPLSHNNYFLSITGELTEFNFVDDYTVFAIPGDYDTDEFLYTTSPISDLDNRLPRSRHSESTLIDGLAVQTPVIMKHPEGKVYVNLHEAALVGYPAMALDVNPQQLSFVSHLTPGADGMKAYVQLPFCTPWRTMIISDDARDILASQLIYNLNEPSKIEDTSWIYPQKFIGVWWEMFVGYGSWAYSDDISTRPGVTDYASVKPSGRHAANNANVKKYIDFAAQSGIKSVLVEGWNEGWETWTEGRKNRHFLFDKAYPDFDVEELSRYAKERGVKLIMHHETSANAADYERQLDAAFDFMNKYGYDAVKTGYVGYIIPRGEHHSSQWMNDHYIEVVRRAAEHHIMVNSHEAVRPTGLMRTWPNWVAQESARGGEYEAMGGNPPEHTTLLPFTRLKGGPMDYTPGIMETDLASHGHGNSSHPGTTIARQLALYLTMPSPLQMACDRPDSYLKYADAFEFIKVVPVDWRTSVYLEAEPGDYITVARQDKNSEDWYIGAITDENSRTAKVKLDFLPKGKKYVATIYADGKDADYRTNPKSYNIYSKNVDCKSTLTLQLAPGGGAAVQLKAID